MISSARDPATSLSGVTPPLLFPSLNLKEYMGAIDGITTRVVIFIDADAEMV
jgi:hypothetical protein